MGRGGGSKEKKMGVNPSSGKNGSTQYKIANCCTITSTSQSIVDSHTRKQRNRKAGNCFERLFLLVHCVPVDIFRKRSAFQAGHIGFEHTIGRILCRYMLLSNPIPSSALSLAQKDFHMHALQVLQLLKEKRPWDIIPLSHGFVLKSGTFR